MKKNLVLGVAKGYSWDILEPFVISFAQHCPNAEVVLFVDDISDFTFDKLLQAGVLLRTFPNKSKIGVPNNTRWEIFSDFLEANGDNYNQIFITDTRDVIFQGDVFRPFENYSSYIGFTTEIDDISGSKTGDKTNYDWIVDCFDKSTADKLLDKKIICCGTVIGTVNEMKIFCRELQKILENKTTNIFDQAVTNYLVYNNLLPIRNLVEIDVAHGEIFTMGLTNNFTLRDNLILRPDGEVPAVVHQYNRHNELIDFVDDFYHEKNFQVDLRFTDIRSVIEQSVCLLFEKRIGDATRLFTKKFLVTKDFRDCSGALMRLWEITMRNPLSPASEILELSAQIALRSAVMSSNFNVEEICKLLKRALKYNHPIDPEFKNFVVSYLLKMAVQKFEANEREQYLFCIKLINLIEGLQSNGNR